MILRIIAKPRWGCRWGEYVMCVSERLAPAGVDAFDESAQVVVVGSVWSTGARNNHELPCPSRSRPRRARGRLRSTQAGLSVLARRSRIRTVVGLSGAVLG